MSDKAKILKDSIKSLRSAIDDWQALDEDQSNPNAIANCEADNGTKTANTGPERIHANKAGENTISSPELIQELRKQLQDLS